MVLPASSDRANETFVQWKEPVQSNRDRGNANGDASTSRVRKNKQPRRLPVPHPAAGASTDGEGVEESRHAGSGVAVVSEARGATSSRCPAEVPSTDPLPRFRPPGRIPTTASTVPLRTSYVSQRAPQQMPTMAPQRLYCIPPPRNAVEDRNESTAHEGAGTTAQQYRTAPEGKAYILNRYGIAC